MVHHNVLYIHPRQVDQGGGGLNPAYKKLQVLVCFEGVI